MAKAPIVYGMSFSVYVQVVRLALAEKGIDHELIEVNPFSPEGVPSWYRDIHPFGLMPAFADNNITLYESEAIARYIDDAYPGPRLQPTDHTARARMSQAISILRSYAYHNWVWGLYMQGKWRSEGSPDFDDDKLAKAIPLSRTTVASLVRLMNGLPFLAGTKELTLADLFCAPMLNCLEASAEGLVILAETTSIAEWWERMKQRESVQRFLE
jgi:glutathione S-transferase